MGTFTLESLRYHFLEVVQWDNGFSFTKALVSFKRLLGGAYSAFKQRFELFLRMAAGA